MTEEIKTTELTDSQVTKIYNDLAKEDKISTENLENAKIKTENSDYIKSEEIDTENLVIPGVVQESENVKETNKDYSEILSAYNITEEEVSVLIELINKYKNNEDINYYNNLPKSFKDIADGFRSLSLKENYKMTKNESAKMVLKEIVNDAQINNAIDTFQSDLSGTIKDMNTEYDKIILDAFDDAFSRINEIELKDPEQAAKIRIVKKAFDDSITFEKQKEYINSISANKLNKFTKRYSRETSYFNNLVNITDVKIPDIRELLFIIHQHLPQFEIEDIKKFIVAICKSSYDLQVNKNIRDLAYIYKLISNIYKYKFITKELPEEAKTLFGNIAEVITTCIINK